MAFEAARAVEMASEAVRVPIAGGGAGAVDTTSSDVVGTAAEHVINVIPAINGTSAAHGAIATHGARAADDVGGTSSGVRSRSPLLNS